MKGPRMNMAEDVVGVYWVVVFLKISKQQI